jgi:hypothetical protein
MAKVNHIELVTNNYPRKTKRVDVGKKGGLLLLESNKSANPILGILDFVSKSQYGRVYRYHINLEEWPYRLWESIEINGVAIPLV